MTGTTAVDERKLLAENFQLEGRNLNGVASLWSHPDTPDRTYSDEQALEWIRAKEKKGGKR